MLTKRAAGWVVVAGLLGGCSGGGAGPVRSPTAPEPVRSSVVPVGSPRPSLVPAASPSRVGVPADVPLSGSNARDGERPPVEPGVAGEHSAAGARAFAVFFVQTIDWGYATTSSAYMRHFYAASCIECDNVARALDAARARGRHFIGDRFTVRSSTAPMVRESTASLILTFDVTSAEVVTASGGYVDAEPALTGYRELITLAQTASGWRVRTMAPQ